jgi:hypothetical protein
VAAGDVRRFELLPAACDPEEATELPAACGRTPPEEAPELLAAAGDLAAAEPPTPADGTRGSARGTGLDVVERSTKSDSGSGRRGELCVLISRS